MKTKIAICLLGTLGWIGVSTAEAQVPNSYGLAASQTPYYLAQSRSTNPTASELDARVVQTVYYPTAQVNPCECPPTHIVQSPPIVESPYAMSPQVAPVPQATYRPIVPLVTMPPQVEVGRGILGQPTVYVPGQPIRNFLRYFSP